MTWQDGRLRFAVGFEDTFVPQARIGARPLDEYELTQHYHFWSQDLSRAAEVGATTVRWGIPWYRVNPEQGRWDFSWLDRVVERFDKLGLEVIVDLMHYGTPLWLDNEFLNASYPQRVAEYAGRVAGRYGTALAHYTPLNEPTVNALFCGAYGVWPPYLRGDDGFVRMVRALTRGIVLTQDAVVAAAPQATFVHVEAASRFEGDEAMRTEVEHLRERSFLIQDLVTGRVGADHPLLGYLTEHGFTDDDLSWAVTHTAQPDVMGVNYYPQLSTDVLEAGQPHVGSLADPRRHRNAWTEGLREVLEAFARRYGRPVFLTETCVTGSVRERLDWLDASVAEVRRARGEGLDVVGYTWWPLTDMVEWTYREAVGPVMEHHLPMGLFDLVEDGAGVLRRVRNPVAWRYAEHAAGRLAAVL